VVPDALRRELDREPLPDDGFTILVLSADGQWPHLAMVSRGEVVCEGEGSLLLALWPTSTSCANLTRAGRVTLCAVIDDVAYSVRGRVWRLEDLETPSAGTLARFRIEVEAVIGDQAPYAVLESGVRFRLRDPQSTLGRWREVRAELHRTDTGS
jgi:hypothetical protein